MTYSWERQSHHLGACLDGLLFDFRLRALEPRRDSCSCCPKVALIALALCQCRLKKEYGSCYQHVPCFWPRAPPFLSALGLLILFIVSEKVRNKQHHITRLNWRNIRNLRCATRFCIRLLSSGSVTSDHSVSCTPALFLLIGEAQLLLLSERMSGLCEILCDL